MPTIKKELPKLIEYAELELPEVDPRGDLRAKLAANLSPRLAYQFKINPDLSLEYYLLLYSELVKNCSELAVELAPGKYLVLFSHLPQGKYTHLSNYILRPELLHQPITGLSAKLDDSLTLDLNEVQPIKLDNYGSQLYTQKFQVHLTQNLQITGQTDPLTALVYLALYASYAQTVKYNNTLIF